MLRSTYFHERVFCRGCCIGQGAKVNLECWFILRLCSSFISLEVFLAKAESLEGKQKQQHAFQSYEAEEGIYATHSSGSGLYLTNINYFYHLIVLQ